MERIDILLVNGFVVMMDADFRVFPRGGVAILGDEIVAVDLGTRERDEETVLGDQA
mgnify:CR=1 FL=1